MSFDDEIIALLQSESSINHLLALELIHSQWEWPLDKALEFIFTTLWDAYGVKALEQWEFSIGQFEIGFSLEINDENPYAVFNWDLFLILSLKKDNHLLYKDSYFVDTIQRGEPSRNIKEMKKEAHQLFKKALKPLSSYFNKNS